MSKRRVILVSFSSVIVAGLLVLAFCPKPTLYGDTTFSAVVLDRDGQLLRLALADDDRYRLHNTLSEISPAAIQATLLYEDRHFYRHPGFNPGSLVRAFWSTYVKRDRPIGASTITMQLARIRFDLDSRSVAGKTAQIARAIQIERHYGKDEILNAYLNLAPYGGNIEGIGTASLVYFDKPAANLSMPEALALAVIPQNPVRRDPSTKAGYQQMAGARQRLLAMWLDARSLDPESLAQFDLPLAVRPTSQLPFRAPHFAQSMLASRAPQQGPITTTLDLGHQTTLERHIYRYVDRARSKGLQNASALLIDYRTMEVVASVGSADFFDSAIAGQVDGTRAKRSPGSTLKPFVYGLAIDQGIIHPSSLLKDAPTRFAAYTPENFDLGFMGPVKAKDALIYSRNVPATELLSRVGHKTFHRYLLDAGVVGLSPPDHYGLAMILGGNELTMHELVSQYAMLANGGLFKPLRSRIDDPSTHRGLRLLSPEASFLVLDMLRDNPRPGTLGGHRQHDSVRIAWKTGTSYAFRDAWTVGTFGPYVLAAWVGNFDGSPNPAFVGRSAAAPLFFEIADALMANSRDVDFAQPSYAGLNIEKIDVCADTGDLPGRHCPRTEKAWFIPGVSPIKVSDIHRAIRVDSETGLRVCHFDNENTREEVFEFWPSDILSLYRRAGVAVRQPPAWAAECEMAHTGATGLPPRISSPAPGVSYQMRIDRLADERIPLQATTDSDASTVFWFVDDQFIASGDRDETIFWKPVIGDHKILAVDDLGRSHSRKLTVQLAL
ncbi:MAG: penicillin-binding protein 1C [Pseudomonadota bacterium]